MTPRAWPLFLFVALVGCDGPHDPFGGDAGAIDAQVEDSGSPIDAHVDDGGAADAAADGGAGDAGPQPDAGASCGPTLGLPCTDACASGFTCVNERCVPERAGCGGIAGDECAASYCCSYPSGSSAGICVTPQESACLGARAPDEFAPCELTSR